MANEPISGIAPAYSQNLRNIQVSQELFQNSIRNLSPSPQTNSLDPVARLGNTLLDRAGELNTVQDNIGQSQSTIQAANNGLDALSDFVRLGQAVLDPSFANNNPDFRAQYNEIINQANSLAQDANYRGTNLIAGNDDLTTSFNPERTSQLQTENAGALGLERITDFTNASINQATASLNDAEGLIGQVQTRFGSDQAILGIRDEFTENISNTYAEGADRLLDVNEAEEVVNLITANTQIGFGQEVLAQEAERNSNILRLF